MLGTILGLKRDESAVGNDGGRLEQVRAARSFELLCGGKFAALCEAVNLLDWDAEGVGYSTARHKARTRHMSRLGIYRHMSSTGRLCSFGQITKVGRMTSVIPEPSVGGKPQWTLSDRLRKARENAGMEQEALARLTGLSRATISAAENGHRTPSKTSLSIWAMATGVSRDWLSSGTDPEYVTLTEAKAALSQLRFTALSCVITAARGTGPGAGDADQVLAAVARRESEVQASGSWVASSSIEQPEVLAWCRIYRSELAQSIEDAASAVRNLTSDGPSGPGGGGGPGPRYFMSPLSDSNRRPSLYKSGALAN